jgi:hypothetical protein
VQRSVEGDDFEHGLTLTCWHYRPSAVTGVRKYRNGRFHHGGCGCKKCLRTKGVRESGVPELSRGATNREPLSS